MTPARGAFLGMILSFLVYPCHRVVAKESQVESKDSAQEAKPLKVYVSGSNRKPYDQKAGAIALFTFSQAVFGRGLEIEQDLAIKPGFIKSWSWDFEHEKYVLKVDTTKKFHSGRSITAEDVEFMLVKSHLSPINLKARKWLLNVLGLPELKPGTVFRTGLASGIKVTGPDTLEIKLRHPNPAFLFNLGRSVPSLVPRELLTDDLVTFRGSPVGAGDYAVDFDDPKSTSVRLKSVGRIHERAPKIVELINEGDPLAADIVIGPRVNPQEGRYKLLMGDTPGYVNAIQFNYANVAGSNPTFRAAIHHALNRVEIAQSQPFFSPAFELLVTGMVGRIKAQDPYDLAKAKKLVASLPASIRAKTQTVYLYGDLKWNPQTKVIERQLGEAGLQVRFVGVPGQLRLRPEDKEIAMFMIGSMADYLDPLNCFADYLPGAQDTFQHPENDTKYVQLFENAMRAESLDQRSLALQELSRYFAESHMAVPVFEQRASYWVDPSRVESLEDQPVGAELNLAGVRLR